MSKSKGKPGSVRLEFPTSPPSVTARLVSYLPPPTSAIGKAVRAGLERLTPEQEFAYLKALTRGSYVRRAAAHVGGLLKTASKGDRPLLEGLAEDLGRLEVAGKSTSRWFHALSGMRDPNALIAKAFDLTSKTTQNLIKSNPAAVAVRGARYLAPHAGPFVDKVLARAIQDPKVSMDLLRRVPDAISQQLQAATGLPVETLAAAGEFGLELERAFQTRGLTLNLASRSLKPLVRVAPAGQSVRGYISLFSVGGPTARQWVHVRKDLLGSSMDVLREQRVLAAARRLGKSAGNIKLPRWLVGAPSTPLLRQLGRRLNPSVMARNVWSALRPPSRSTLHLAFRRAPVGAKLGAIVRLGGKILVAKSFVDWVKGADKYTFPATILLPGPMRIAWFVGMLFANIFKGRKARRHARALESARNAALMEYNRAVESYRKEIQRYKRVQREKLIGSQRFRGRIAALLVRTKAR